MAKRKELDKEKKITKKKSSKNKKTNSKKESKVVSKSTELKRKRSIKIGSLEIELGSIPALIILMVLIVAYFLSPTAFVVTTARYNRGSVEENKQVREVFGNRTDYKFALYFQWYNVIHELGHGIIEFNSEKEFSEVEEEQLVNDFAVAYWRHFGEDEKMADLANLVDYALTQVDSPAKNDETYLEYAKDNWNDNDFYTFNNYGWFQFSAVKSALSKDMALEEALINMGVEDFDLGDRDDISYENLGEETSTAIINDAVVNFRGWGLKYPKVYHKFSNNPNNNYCRPMKNYLGLLDLLYD